MNPYIIVGGGVSGLIAAHALSKRGLPFIGIEKGDVLGGRAQSGQHRWYQPSSIEYLETLVPGMSFERIEEAPKLRKKNEWQTIEEEFPEDETFYLGSPFFHSTLSPRGLIDSLALAVKDNFQLRKEVTEILPESKEVVFQDGSRIHFEKIVWCSPLEPLNKIWKGDKLDLFKFMKKAEPTRGGIQLELEMSVPLFDCRNTVIFPFRFKDNKLRALGSSEVVNTSTESPQYLLHWLLFLDSEISEDREEVAKCLRALRRELEKEFPEIKTAVKQERIIFLDTISGETPLPSKTLEVLTDLIYVGPEICVGKGGEDTRNWDRILDNCRHLESLLDNSASP